MGSAGVVVVVVVHLDPCVRPGCCEDDEEDGYEVPRAVGHAVHVLVAAGSLDGENGSVEHLQHYRHFLLGQDSVPGVDCDEDRTWQKSSNYTENPRVLSGRTNWMDGRGHGKPLPDPLRLVCTNHPVVPLVIHSSVSTRFRQCLT